MYTDIEIFKWLENNEHWLDGDLYYGYTLTTTWGSYTGSSLRSVVSMALDKEQPRLEGF